MVWLFTDRPFSRIVDFAEALSDGQVRVASPADMDPKSLIPSLNANDVVVWDTASNVRANMLNELLSVIPNLVFVLARRVTRRRKVGFFVRGRANTLLFGRVEGALRSAGLIAQTRIINLYRPQATGLEETKLDFDRMFAVQGVDEVSFVPVPAGGDVGPRVRELLKDLDMAVFGLPSYLPENHFLVQIFDAWVSGTLDTDLVFVKSGSSISVSEGLNAYDLFVRNTYPAGYFVPSKLADLKRKNGVSVLLVLPTLNEEQTLSGVIQAFVPLWRELKLVDRVLLMDSASTDRSVEIAKSYGLEAYVHQQIKPELGAYKGKGEAMWKSLFLAKEDLVVFMDTDLTNPNANMIVALLGPLIIREDVKLVKGFFHRGAGALDRLQAGGGRVTEITARPLINLFTPDLAFLFQPLAGPTAGRRDLLMNLPFYTGYGVEIGMLLATAQMHGAQSVAQSDIGGLVHRNQPVEALTRMSVEVLQAMLDLLGLRPCQEEVLQDHLVYTLMSEKRYALLPRAVRQAKRPPVARILDLPSSLGE